MNRQCDKTPPHWRQRAFISLGLTGYLALGAGAVILALLIAVKVQTARLDAEKQSHEATRLNLVNWLNAAKSCSDATEKAAKEAAKRQQDAARALAGERARGKGLRDEVERLRGSRASGGACPAGEAVSWVREGLK